VLQVLTVSLIQGAEVVEFCLQAPDGLSTRTATPANSATTMPFFTSSGRKPATIFSSSTGRTKPRLSEMRKVRLTIVKAFPNGSRSGSVRLA
jgi:hypothetical protein